MILHDLADHNEEENDKLLWEEPVWINYDNDPYAFGFLAKYVVAWMSLNALYNFVYTYTKLYEEFRYVSEMSRYFLLLDIGRTINGSRNLQKLSFDKIEVDMLWED